MLPIIVFVGIVAVAWRLQYWPFDRSYKYLPKFGDNQHCKSVTTTKPGE